MSQKCPFCGENTPAGAEFCPNCGTRLTEKPAVQTPDPAEKNTSGRARYDKPRTIAELQAFCRDKGMPLEKMRFFIGEDYPAPRAFGIYRAEDGDFVVYKNKDDGTRAVRYKGPDEAFAVNELYEKLKSETRLRSGSGQTRGTPQRTASKRRRSALTVALAATIIMIAATIATTFFAVRSGGHTGDAFRRGYYAYEDQNYYYDGDDWYRYDPGWSDWFYYEDDAPLAAEDSDAYYRSYSYDESYGVTDFSETEYYYDYDDDDYYSSSDDYDWDSGYDSWDSWDSGGTDWSSEW